MKAEEGFSSFIFHPLLLRLFHWNRDRVHHFFDDLFGVASTQACLCADDETMRENERRKIFYIVGQNKIATLERGERVRPGGMPWEPPAATLAQLVKLERVLETRRMVREHYAAKQAAAGREAVFPLALPSMPTFRATRAVVGRATLVAGGEGRRAEDSIGLVADWRKAASVWEVPFGALVPEKVRGLLTAGRCISSVGDAWHVTRVIPPAALTGQASGVAACLAARAGVTPDRLDPAQVQEALRRRGMPLHVDELPEAAS